MGYWRFIRQDWALLGFGLLMAALSGPGQTFFVGLFRDEITSHFGISIGTFGLIFSSATLLSAVIFFWSGKFVDRWPVEKTTTVFALLFAASALLMGFAPHLIILCIAVFGIRHLGQGLMGHISGTTMARFFHHNRAKAISLASMGYSVSEAIFPIAVVFLIAASGWRVTWWVIAAAIALVFLPLAQLFLKATHRDLSLDIELPETEVKAGEAPTVKAAGSEPSPTEPEESWSRKDVLKDPRFYFILPAAMASPYILTGFFFHQASLAGERGLSMEVIAGFFSFFAFAKIAGSLFAGPLADRFGPLRAYPWPIAGLAIALYALALFESTSSVLFFYVVSGFAVGASIPISGSLWPTLYGTRYLGAVKSMVASIMVLSTGLAPASYGFLLDAGVTISQIAIATAIYTTAAVIPVLLLALRR